MEKNFKYLHVRVYGNKDSIPVLVDLNTKIKLGQYIFIKDIEGSWPVHKVSYCSWQHYSEKYLYYFDGIDYSKAISGVVKPKVYRTTYEELQNKEFTYKGHRYLYREDKKCILKSVKEGEIIDLDPFYYHGLEMHIHSFEFSLSGKHIIGGVNVTDINPYYSYDNGILYNKDKTAIIKCIDDNIVITIPKTVKKISKEAFAHLDKCNKIIFKGFIDEIEYDSFIECSSLCEIVFEDGVKLFYLEYINECPNLTYIKCNTNNKSITKGTIYVKDITLEKGCYYTRCDNNPYYFLSSLVYGYENKPEDIYNYPDDIDEPTSDFWENPEKYLIISAKDQKQKIYNFNKNLVVISNSCFDILKNHRKLIVNHGNITLEYNNTIRNYLTYHKDICDAYFGNWEVKYNALLEVLYNLDQFELSTKEDKYDIINAIQALPKENHITYIVKYKQFDEIIELINIGLLSIKDAEYLYNIVSKKTSVDPNIAKQISNYIVKSMKKREKLIRYKDKKIYISDNIINCNIDCLKLLLKQFGATIIDDYKHAEYVIAGFDDDRLIEFCIQNNIKWDASDKYSNYKK